MRKIIQTINKIDQILIERQENNWLSKYNTKEPIHKKQIEFHKCNKRNRWVFGGNRSGKTECGAVETVWLSRGIHPFKNNKKTYRVGLFRFPVKCKEMLLKAK